MSTKHVFNNPNGLVVKSLRGAIALNPNLRILAESKVVYNAERSESLRVAIISGGGAGHEPAHAGYTGRGLLSACVSGDIFASPSASQILTCIKLAIAIQRTADILLVINNYTGDRLNFGLAAERAKAELGGVNIESVVVADDVSLLSKPSLVGARGLAGNILICKILGAAAEAGLSLKELKALGDAAVDCLASVGVGLEHCHVPGRKVGTDILTADECELGLGLHNEPGVCRMALQSPESLITEMLDQILNSRRARSEAFGETSGSVSFVDFGDVTVLYINNLGGMSILEMCAIVDEVLSQLDARGIHPARILSASYMTSLNAPGYSISLLNVSAISRFFSPQPPLLTSIVKTPEEILSLIDAPTNASAWAGITTRWPPIGSRRDLRKEEQETETLLSSLSSSSTSTTSRVDIIQYSWDNLGISVEKLCKAIREACAAVLSVESELTEFDTVLGDGDCGETFASGAKAVLRAIDMRQLDGQGTPPAQFIGALADLLVNSMGGTSGAIFGLYFTALSTAFSSFLDSSSSSVASAPLRALEALSAYTPARPGDRTLVDALHPFCVALSSGRSFEEAVKDARKGAESTRNMEPKLGRAVYVGVHSQEHKRLPPDPGAWGVKAILEGLERGISS